MGAACGSCGGVGFGHIEPGAGYRDTGQPCPSCNADGAAKPPGSFTKPTPARGAGLEWVDGVGKSSADDSGTDAVGAGFSPAQIERQAALDAAAMARE
jgi:hypothetical protein